MKRQRWNLHLEEEDGNNMVTYKAKYNNFGITVGEKAYRFNPYYSTDDEKCIVELDKFVKSGDLKRVKFVEKTIKVEEVEVVDSDVPVVGKKTEDDLDKILKENENTSPEGGETIECEFGQMTRKELNSMARAKGYTGTLNGGKDKEAELIAFIKNSEL